MAAHAQGKFWEYHDVLFANSLRPPRRLQPKNLKAYARDIGLDMKKFKKFTDGNRGEKHIKRDQALAAKIGARGTPTSFVNGYMIRGAQPISAFKEVIDRELAR